MLRSFVEYEALEFKFGGKIIWIFFYNLVWSLFCNGHLDQILQVIFSTLESYTGDNVGPSSGYFSGYTEVNLGLCSGHLQWTMVVQTCEKYPAKMARENHIVKSDFTLMVKSVIPS